MTLGKDTVSGSDYLFASTPPGKTTQEKAHFLDASAKERCVVLFPHAQFKHYLSNYFGLWLCPLLLLVMNLLLAAQLFEH
jgi:hypothetical protein